jgi:hypothetical protein
LHTIDLTIFDVRWRIRCADGEAFDLIRRNFREFECSFDSAPPDEQIRVETAARTPWRLIRRDRAPLLVADSYELLYAIEKTVTIDTQHRRPDLFFLHAAALALDGYAVLLIASSGSGKSTTAWAMTHRGFGYMSDELAPIDLDSMNVQPYPHALCLKDAPPSPFELPESSIITAHTLHVPTDCMASVCRHPMPLRAVFFNQYDPNLRVPTVKPLGIGEASALVYSNGLNQLAHDRAGLAAAVKIAGAATCYGLTTSDLDRTCELLADVLRSNRCDQST